MGRTVGIRPPSGTSGIVSRCPNFGTQDGKDSGIQATQWDKWDYPGMSQLSQLGQRMGRTVGFGPPSGTNGIILGCPNCPWDTGWEGQWDLGHPVG